MDAKASMNEQPMFRNHLTKMQVKVLEWSRTPNTWTLFAQWKACMTVC